MIPTGITAHTTAGRDRVPGLEVWVERLRYTAGDHLAVWPKPSVGVRQGVIERYGDGWRIAAGRDDTTPGVPLADAVLEVMARMPVRFTRCTGSAFTLWTWPCPDCTTWAARPETHPTTGDADRRHGWAIMHEDRHGGWVIVGNASSLKEARSLVGDPAWRRTHGLNDPARRPTGET